MARGGSGRIVLEVDPELKRAIYRSLDQRGQTLKNWFTEAAEVQLINAAQLPLDFSERMPFKIDGKKS